MRGIPTHPYEHCKRIRGLNMGHIQRYHGYRLNQPYSMELGLP